MKPTILEPTLRQMEDDAKKAKSDLHLAAHVTALVTEVRQLSAGNETTSKPTAEQVQTALKFLDWMAHNDRPVSLELAASLTAARDKAVALIDRFLS